MKNFHRNLDIIQYNETNVMHLLFNILRIKGVYMFLALPAHPQEALVERFLRVSKVSNVRCM
jgi:hypothetical protein